MIEQPVATARDDRFINRELSWLEFGARLLDLAADHRLPLFERTKFLAIFAEELDEFFQVRVAGLEDQVAAGLRTRSPDGMQPAEQLETITARVAELVERQSRIFADQVVPALAAAGVVLSDWHTLDEDDRAYLMDVFNRQIFPVLTPLAVDPGHPFPYISNLSLNLVVRVVDPVTGEGRIARVKVPPLLSRFVVLPDGERFVPLEQVIAAQLDTLFPSMTIAEPYAFRVTRNADLSVEEDEADDLLAAVELELQRRRFGQAVRLEVASDITTELLDMLIAAVDVPEDNVTILDVPIDLSGLWAVVGLDRPDLAAAPWSPVTSPPLAALPGAGSGPVGSDLFAVIAAQDVLVHHPYDSFVTSVETFIAQAADDPDVLAIKQTLYRTSGDSSIVASLIRASRAGKQVAAVVELQARFDEQANIAWARALEEAGVHVVYGLIGLKTHLKTSMVVRREGEGTRRYCHVGTGNYNPRTARFYEDLGLLTSNAAIGADIGELFNFLTGPSHPTEFRHLVVAPMSLRSHLLTLIDEQCEAGPEGRIVLKTNGITDPEIIDGLYRASSAGVAVDLIVRGRCCIRAGVPGLSETIRVRSIVGQYLEHSRIFRFGGIHGHPLRIAIGSADLMERNLDRRIEALVPIDDETLQVRLVAILDDALRDEANSWSLGADDRWSRIEPAAVPGFSLQSHLRAQALERSRHPLEPGRATPPATEGGRSVVPAPAPSPTVVSEPAPPPGSGGPPCPPGRRRWWQWLLRRKR